MGWMVLWQQSDGGFPGTPLAYLAFTVAFRHVVKLFRDELEAQELLPSFAMPVSPCNALAGHAAWTPMGVSFVDDMAVPIVVSVVSIVQQSQQVAAISADSFKAYLFNLNDGPCKTKLMLQLCGDGAVCGAPYHGGW